MPAYDGDPGTAAFNSARCSTSNAGGTTTLFKNQHLGAPSANARAHWPIVWASRSNAWATAAAVLPCASSHTACHLSRSLGVGARYIRRRTSTPSMHHRPSSAPISSMPNNNPHSDFLILSGHLNRPYLPYPNHMRVSPWLWFSRGWWGHPLLSLPFAQAGLGVTARQQKAVFCNP